jgi:hypothetical protein
MKQMSKSDIIVPERKKSVSTGGAFLHEGSIYIIVYDFVLFLCQFFLILRVPVISATRTSLKNSITIT